MKYQKSEGNTAITGLARVLFSLSFLSEPKKISFLTGASLIYISLHLVQTIVPRIVNIDSRPENKISLPTNFFFWWCRGLWEFIVTLSEHDRGLKRTVVNTSLYAAKKTQTEKLILYQNGKEQTIMIGSKMNIFFR